MPAPGGFDDSTAKLRLEVMTAGEVNVGIGALYLTLLVGLAYTLIASGVAGAAWADRPPGASAAAVAAALAPALPARAAAVGINLAGVGVAALFLLALAAIPVAERTEEQVWTAVLLGAGLLCTSPMTLAGLPTDLPVGGAVAPVATVRPAVAALRAMFAPGWPAMGALFPPLTTAGLLRILTDAVYTASATFYLLSASHSYRLLLRPGSRLERARFYGPKVAAVVLVFLIKGVLAAAAGVSLGFVPFARALSVFRLARVGELPPLVGAAALAAVALDVAIAMSTLTAMRATGRALAAQPYAETRTKQLGFRCFAYQTPACATAMVGLRVLTIGRLPIEVLVLTARPPPPSIADASLVPPVANLGIAAVYLTSTALVAYMNLPAGLWREGEAGPASDASAAAAAAAAAGARPGAAAGRRGGGGSPGLSAAASSTALAPSLSAGGRVPLLMERSLARVFFTAIHRVFSAGDRRAAATDGALPPERAPLVGGRRSRVRLPSSGVTSTGKGIPWGRDMPLRYRHREWRVLSAGLCGGGGGRGGDGGYTGRSSRQRRRQPTSDSSDSEGGASGDPLGSPLRAAVDRARRRRRRRRRRRDGGGELELYPPPPSMAGTYPSGPVPSVGSYGDYLGGPGGYCVDSGGYGFGDSRDLTRGLAGRGGRLKRHSTLARWEHSLLDADPDRGCYFRLGMKKNVLVMQTVVLMVNCAYLAYIPGNAREELVPEPVPVPPPPPPPPPRRRRPPPASMATEGADELGALLAQERHDLLLAGGGGAAGGGASLGGLDVWASGMGGGAPPPSAVALVPQRGGEEGGALTGGGHGAGRQTVSQPHSWSRASSLAAAPPGGVGDPWGRRPLSALAREPALMSSPALDTWGRRPLLPSTGPSSVVSAESGGGGAPGVAGAAARPGPGAPAGGGRGGPAAAAPTAAAAAAAATAGAAGAPGGYTSADGLRVDPFALADSRGFTVVRYITAPSLSAHALVLVSGDRVVVTFSGTRDATNWAANLEVSSIPLDDLFTDELPLDPALGGLAALAKEVLTLGVAAVHGGHGRVYKQLRPEVLSVIANLYAPPVAAVGGAAGGEVRRCGRRLRRGGGGGSGSGLGGAAGRAWWPPSDGGGSHHQTPQGGSSTGDAAPSRACRDGKGSRRPRAASVSTSDDSSVDSTVIVGAGSSSSSTDTTPRPPASPPPALDPATGRPAYDAARWRGRGRGKPLFFTGHSMGGSLATLASYEAARHWVALGLGSAEDVAVTTFGAPRVGNSAFALRYDATVATHWRVVLAADPVVRQPRLLGYHHVGVEVLLDRAGRLVVDPSFVETAWWASAVGAATGYRLHFRASYVLAVKAACRAYRGGVDDLAEDFWPFVLGDHVHRLFRVPNRAGGGGGGGAASSAGADRV